MKKILFSLVTVQPAELIFLIVTSRPANCYLSFSVGVTVQSVNLSPMTGQGLRDALSDRIRFCIMSKVHDIVIVARLQLAAWPLAEWMPADTMFLYCGIVNTRIGLNCHFV